jgi:hypothetical protein
MKGSQGFNGKELRYPNIIEFTTIMILILGVIAILGTIDSGFGQILFTDSFAQILFLAAAACSSVIISILLKMYLMRDSLFF